MVNEPVATIPERRTYDTIEVPLEGTDTDIWKFDWRSGLVSISGLGLLYGLYKGSKAFLRNIA